MKILVKFLGEREVNFSSGKKSLTLKLAKKVSGGYARRYGKLAKFFGDCDSLRALFFFCHFGEKFYSSELTEKSFRQWKKRHWDAKAQKSFKKSEKIA